MTGPPLDAPLLVALLAASDDEADQAQRGEALPAAEALQMALWRQRRAIIAALSFSPRRRPKKPHKPANDRDQLEMF